MRPQHKTIKRNQRKAKPNQAEAEAETEAEASQKPPKRKASATDATGCGKCPCRGAALWPQLAINQVVAGRIYRPKSKSTSDQVRFAMGREEKTCQALRKMAKRKTPHVMAAVKSCLRNFFEGT